MKRLTGEFLARDGRGNRCTLEVWTDFLSPGVHGCSEIRTSKGEEVHELGNGEYKILSSGVILQSDSRAAP
ncbi:MAG TPA: hypothetical protein VMS17_09360 [Gemmataceae bacterium]|nr:hypothetical protein [Gemmataceae bacterium]